MHLRGGAEPGAVDQHLQEIIDCAIRFEERVKGLVWGM